MKTQAQKDREAIKYGYQFCECGAENIDADYYACPRCNSESIKPMFYIPGKADYSSHGFND